MSLMLGVNNFSIEKIELGDVDDIINLYQKFRKNWCPCSNFTEKLEKYPALKVIVENNMVGFAYCYSFAPDILELSNIYIDEEYRAKNLGTTLLINLEKEIATTKYTGLILNNSDAYEGKVESKSSTNFYLNNGYKLITRTNATRVFYKELKNENSKQ